MDAMLKLVAEGNVKTKDKAGKAREMQAEYAKRVRMLGADVAGESWELRVHDATLKPKSYLVVAVLGDGSEERITPEPLAMMEFIEFFSGMEAMLRVMRG